MSQEHQVTVRVQKVKKQRIQMKIFLFTALAAALLLITIFAKYICPYDPVSYTHLIPIPFYYIIYVFLSFDQ